jgi:phospholipid/cholesterol/gamma-HCH transport system permease protein
MMNVLARPFELVGRMVLALAADIGKASILLWHALKAVFIPPYEHKLLFKQIEQIGISSLPVVLVVNTFVGMVFALNSFAGFERFSAAEFTAPVVALAITREMAPVMTALIVAARAGSAMAAEIGTMKVTEQIDALWTLATNPINYLVVPRLVAAILVMPLLVLVADSIGLWGGYVVATGILGQSPEIYVQGTWSILTYNDILGGLIKATVFGFLLALISCHYGFTTKGGAEGVGISTTRTVVVSFIVILVADFFLTRMLNWG